MDGSDGSNAAGMALPPPKGLMQAWSEIKQLALMEKGGRPLDKDFFTPEMYLAFVKTAIHQSVKDTIIWVLGYILLGAIVYYIEWFYFPASSTDILFFRFQGHPLYWFLKIGSYSSIVYSTMICCACSKHYSGNAPRQANQALLHTRAMFLICMAIFTFFALALVYKYVLTDDAVVRTAKSIGMMNYELGRRVYLFLTMYMRRAIFEDSIVVMLTMGVSVVLPYLTLLFFKYFRRRKKVLGVER